MTSDSAPSVNTEDFPPLADTSVLRDPPTTPRGVRTRAALVEAARTVFERDGYLEARLADITAEARVAIGTFYSYFASKEEILQAVLKLAQSDVLHPVLPNGAREGSLLHEIEVGNRAYFEAYRRNARLMRILGEVAAVDAKFRRTRERYNRAYIDCTARWLRNLQERGLAPDDLDPYLSSVALSGMLDRLAFDALGGGEFSEDTPFEELLSTANALTINLLRLDVG